MSINANRLPPAKPDPERTVLQSSDLDIRTCEHELAAAMASFAFKSQVPLFATTKEFERAGEAVAELVRQGQKCPLKGVS